MDMALQALIYIVIMEQLKNPQSFRSANCDNVNAHITYLAIAAKYKYSGEPYFCVQ